VIDASTPVVVIFRGGYGALSIARTLGRWGVPVYLVAQEGVPTPVWSSRYWVERSRWDFSRPEDESVEFLLELGQRTSSRHGKRALLLTLADWIAIFIERHRDRLAEQLRFPQPEHPIIHELLNKWGMHQLAREHGIPTPTTVFPASLDEAERFLEDTGTPIVMKPADPYLADLPPTKVIRSRQELLDHLGPRVDRHASLNVVLQEFVPGEVDSVWMCNGYFGERGTQPLTFTGTKLRQVSAAGVASLAVCIPNETVASQTRHFMEAVGYRGCVGIGYRYDRRDGLYKLLDVNARVSGVFRLFAGTNEIDVVRACYLDMTGQDVPPSALQPGRKWMLEDDLGAALSAIRGRQLTTSDWMRSLRGVKELHWLASDDPVPGLVWFGGRIRRLGSYGVKRMAKVD
jgi:D-aspartate ligase